MEERKGPPLAFSEGNGAGYRDRGVASFPPNGGWSDSQKGFLKHLKKSRIIGRVGREEASVPVAYRMARGLIGKWDP